MISSGADDSTVILTIPMRAEYVSIARLTAAGAANRMGFDIETIEDIKVSLSEVCNRIINTQKKFSDSGKAECKIEFVLSKDSLRIDFFVNNIEPLDYFNKNGAVSQDDIGEVCVDSINEDSDGGRRVEENCEDQIQLSLITCLMDEFIVNPSDSCLVSMKKFLD